MATFTRTASDLQCSPSSPVTIGVVGSVTSAPIDLTASGTLAEAELTAVVKIGPAALTTNPQVQWQYSYDGATWFNDGGPRQVPIGVVDASYAYGYPGRRTARYGQVVITNGAGNPITAFVQGSKLGVS